jgi:DNA polymerase-3 subunit gamma/tau
LGVVAEALAAGDTKKMLDVVADLEANGRSLQHFARELARYFRNLLVVRIEGKPTRLVAASPPEQEKMLQAASQFSEDDLTRDLKLALDLFRDLQSSLQPRLHLEMGLLRLIHAGRLQPIEEALAALGSAGPAPAPKAPPKAPVNAPPKPAPAATTTAIEGDFRTRLLATLQESKLTHVADAVGRSEVAETPAEITFTAPKMYQMFLKGQEFEAAVRRVAGRTVRITLKVGEAASTPSPAPKPAAGPAKDEAAERALAHPEVKRFQELFPESQVRAVRNLKESEP